MAQTTITIDKNTLLKDAYEGSGGFQDGTYLFQHKREQAAAYETRKSIAYYLNYLQPTVNSHVDPIFRKEPARTTSDAFMTEFLGDVDTKGTPMTKFMKHAGFAAKLMGVAAIVMDNAKEEKKAKTAADALATRQFPYAYVVTKDNFTKWKTDRLGNLKYFAYSEPYQDPNEGEVSAASIAENIKQSDSASAEIQYRIWTPTEWAVCDKDGGIIESGDNPLGRVPVTLLYGKSVLPGKLDVESMFYPIAKTNLRLFNLCSELDEILRNQAFSILIYPHKDPSSLTIGVNNAMGFDGAESKFAPSFIAPPSGPAEWLMKHIDRLIQEMYRMAMLTHLSGGTDESRTGAAKAWDFEATNKVLADFAANCYYTEVQMAKLFAMWTSKDPATFDFSVRYSSDFSIRDTEQELKEAAQALQLQIGGQYDIEIKKKAAQVSLRDVPGADLDKVVADIEAGVTANPQSDPAAATTTSTKPDATDPKQAETE